MISSSNALDIGRMLGWAARPRDVPARHDEYRRLVDRYRSDPDFAAEVDEVFSGAGLYLTVDERDGAVVSAAVDSPLRVRVSEIVKRTQPAQRAVVGVVLLAIARTAYPDPAMLDDPDRAAAFTTRSVVDTLDRAAQSYADQSDQDGEVDDSMLESWRAWLLVAEARPNSQRRSANDRSGIVNKVCKLMVEAGYLNSRGETDGGTWVARPRFRHAVQALCADSELYVQINGLSGSEGQEGNSDG